MGHRKESFALSGKTLTLEDEVYVLLSMDEYEEFKQFQDSRGFQLEEDDDLSEEEEFSLVEHSNKVKEESGEEGTIAHEDLLTLLFDNRIRECRKEAGLTQAEVSSRLGIPQSMFSRWESGKTTPKGKNLIRLSMVLGCTVEDLYGVK
jgi:DNA-binding XRE family transcriptional regulator